MEFLINALKSVSKITQTARRHQLEKVIITLKNHVSGEIKEMGYNNKEIKIIWQKNEESILLDQNFIKFEEIFNKKANFVNVRKFIMKALNMTEN